MADLERVERNDVGRVREWLARAVHAPPNPAWTADGHVSDRWLPASPVTGRLDALEWRVPVTGVASAPVIEPEPASPAPAEISAAPPPQTPGSPDAEVLPDRRSDEPPAKPEPKVEAKPELKPEPIIPLILVPDDPGPEAVDEHEPHAEQDSGGWRKIFG